MPAQTDHRKRATLPWFKTYADRILNHPALTMPERLTWGSLLLLAGANGQHGARGTVVASLRNLSIWTGRSRSSLQRLLHRLERLDMVERQGHHLTIRNWSAYQVQGAMPLASPAEAGTKMGQKRDAQRNTGAQPESVAGTATQPRLAALPGACVGQQRDEAEHVGPTLRDKRLKKTDPVQTCADCVELLEHLNRVAGRTGRKQFRASPTNLEPCHRRHQETSKRTAMSVINLCGFKWRGHPKMGGFLRPITVFRKSGFHANVEDIHAGNVPAESFQAWLDKQRTRRN